ncbi:MAG: hemin uptake protein HemP [Pseudomonadota bacterium]
MSRLRDAPLALDASAAAPSAQPAPRPATPAYDARSLVGRDGLAAILLDGQVYTLRITKQGKLLLTK